MTPLWIVQSNLGSTGDYEKMQTCAHFNEIPFIGVKIRPFTDDVPEDKEPNSPVVIYGSCGMVRAASKTTLSRGIFNSEGFSTLKWRIVYREDFLNYNSFHLSVDMFLKLGNSYNYDIFVRGDEDDKIISGHLTTGLKLRSDLINMEISPYYKLLISAPQEIYDEFRFWVVDGKIVAQSRYGKSRPYSSNINDAAKFATKMIEIYQPHNIFVIDVCDTKNGFKIVELNGFNSSGFYEADVPKIMNAVNRSNYFNKLY